MANAPKSPGRPVKNKALRELLNNPPVPESVRLNTHMVHEYLNGFSYTGCGVVVSAERNEIYGPVWCCKFYVAGKQRVIARGTLHQCVSMRDYAHRYWVCQHRSLEPTLLTYFSKLESFFVIPKRNINDVRISDLEHRVTQLEQRLKPNPNYVSINS